MSDCLQGIVSQQLLPRSDTPGRILAYEVITATPAVRHLIREHATSQLPTVIQTGAQYGMCTMDSSIKDLLDRKIISYDTAISRVKHPDQLMAASRHPTKKRLFHQ